LLSDNSENGDKSAALQSEIEDLMNQIKDLKKIKEDNEDEIEDLKAQLAKL